MAVYITDAELEMLLALVTDVVRMIVFCDLLERQADPSLYEILWWFNLFLVIVFS